VLLSWEDHAEGGCCGRGICQCSTPSRARNVISVCALSSAARGAAVRQVMMAAAAFVQQLVHLVHLRSQWTERDVYNAGASHNDATACAPHWTRIPLSVGRTCPLLMAICGETACASLRSAGRAVSLVQSNEAHRPCARLPYPFSHSHHLIVWRTLPIGVAVP
jgi:hypothetical protein